jgi:hypothetical protein
MECRLLKKVTEWYYENIIQELRERYPSAMRKRGNAVPEDFRAVTKLDSERVTMKIHKKSRIKKKDAEIGNIVFKIAIAILYGTEIT